MKISLYGRPFKSEFKPFIEELFGLLRQNNAHLCIYRPFANFLKEGMHCDLGGFTSFYENSDLPEDTNFMVSVGGDGTFLETVSFVKDSGIPIIGLNAGRLGFLANISQEIISDSFKAIFENKFTYEYRSLIELDTTKSAFEKFNYALNEVTVQKKDSSMITVHTYLNDDYLNSYWTDGLIISTPTGSTAYSMSVGGPIILPNASNFIISPIASHNLTVRPIVIPDNMEVTLKVDCRSDKFLLTLDNQYRQMDKSTEIRLKLAPFKIKMLQLHSNNFYKTLRNKLMWGADRRN